jgi:hypothetical protein
VGGGGGGRGGGGGGCPAGGRRKRSLTSFFAPSSTTTTVVVIVVIIVIVVVVIVVALCVLDNVSRMYARRVVDAARLGREHPWRGGDEGKRRQRRAWKRRERNDLLGPQGCALVACRAAREDGRHRIVARRQGE